MIAHVADLKAAVRIVHLNDQAQALARAFWPGPLTLVAPIRDEMAVCELARAGLSTAAVRVPAHPVAQALLQAFGGVVAAPSANRSGRPSPTTLADAINETGDAAAAALDGGACRVGLESTVVSVLGDAVRLLRPGGLTRDAIEAVVGRLEAAGGEAGRSPGRLALHYAPDAPVRLNVLSPESGEAYLAFGPEAPSGSHIFNLSATSDLAEAATNLFSYLRAADRLRPTAIAVAPIPAHDLGEAINDRLTRAAGFVG